ncbi:unnamed protein product [Caenorhabditis sp. 36 PRJEB53466]|nr:unnamed protein product [Caenorhabditis sp. 36 PRJEB53466]
MTPNASYIEMYPLDVRSSGEEEPIYRPTHVENTSRPGVLKRTLTSVANFFCSWRFVELVIAAVFLTAGVYVFGTFIYKSLTKMK